MSTPIVAEDYDALTWLSTFTCHGPKTVRVMLALFHHVDNRTCRAHPSLESLAAESGLSRRMVIRQIKAATEDGWVEIIEKGYRGHATEYRLTIPDPLPWIATETATVHRDNCKCRECFICRCTWCRNHGQTVKPDYQYERVSEGVSDTNMEGETVISAGQSDVPEGRNDVTPDVRPEPENKVTFMVGKGDTSDQCGDIFDRLGDMDDTPTSLRTSLKTSQRELLSSGSTRVDRGTLTQSDALARHGEKTDVATELHPDFDGNHGTRARCRRLGVDHDECLTAFHDYIADPDSKVHGERSKNWGGVFMAWLSAVVEGEDSEHWNRFFDVSCHSDEYLPREAEQPVPTAPRPSADVDSFIPADWTP